MDILSFATFPSRQLREHATYRLLQPAPLHQPHAGPRFQTEEESRYFQLFRNEVTPHLGGAFNNSLWDMVMAQACEYVPFVLDAVIAIGALARTMKYYGRSPMPSQSLSGLRSLFIPSRDVFMTDYEYCFKQYDKTLKAMKIALLKGEENLRRALIACLLISCFETYVGNKASAIFHAESGITLL
jgi:hypothetical protein